jgi:hypothetical protein
MIRAWPSPYLAPPAPEFADASEPCRVRPALIRPGLGDGGLWRFADHRRQCDAGIEQREFEHLRHRGRRRLSLLAVYTRGRGTNFSVNGLGSGRSDLFQAGAFIRHAVTLRGRVAWAHDFNPDRNIAATFQTLPGASFVVNGAAQASDSALTTASAELKWRNGWSAAATFEGEFSDVTRSYAGKGVVRYVW